ncbi:transcriptional regulator, XRE family with cupin sensor [Fictibacillus solisalsi]|uniref:Transcriptional regulator, XRE family with cupin sensor n=1 Tax=Fictibacillus solisalsi TaxID=459525 RepID=A0A1G9YIL1_9BACL|nr:cupin domain-containing protein [Fictibacillus solisalsi]SDN08456.1 transcriptional regulator, XRE family with cupin sensor [Fictibacillus solisalsi]
MKEIHVVVAENMKAFRRMNKLSLDNVSELTGVSKTMLGQIERGESIPTITTLWKIANGLKVSFTSLIKESTNDITIISKDDLLELPENDGKYKVYPYFPFENDKQFEIYMVEIEPGGYLEAAPHHDGTEEYITVFEGSLELTISGQTYLLEKDQSIRFKANCNHAYHNPGGELTRLNMTINYRSM